MILTIAKSCAPVFLVALLVSASGMADSTAPDPIATVKDVMLGLTVPTSDFVWGVEEEPVDDAGWDAIRLNAAMLAESANLLTAEGRAREGETWTSEVLALVAAASVTISAVTAKDFEGVIDSGEAIYNTCESCHSVYLQAVGN